MKIGYHINYDKADKQSFAPIRAKISIESEAVTKNLPFKIKVKKVWNDGKQKFEYSCNQWNKKEQRLYNFRQGDKYYEEYSSINEFLEDYTYQAKTFFRECAKNRIKVTKDLVRKFFAGEKLILDPKAKSFWDVYDEYVKDCRNSMASNTTRMHNSNKNKLTEFENDMNYKMTFDSVNLQFYDKLKEYILLEKEHGWNYFAAIIKRLKAFMTWSFDRNYHQIREFKKFTATEKKITVIRLSEDELVKLLYFEFENKAYAKARDFLCFGCLTGARYSDLNRLTKDNVQNKYLIYTPQKTKNPKPVKLPLNELHFEIINRYKEQHKLLPRYENQSFNRTLKKACEVAGLNAPTEVLNFKEKEPDTEIWPKHELITSHTGRKTFICMQHEQGTETLTIMSYTGIEKMETIRSYLEVSEAIKEKGMNEMKKRLLKAKKKADREKRKNTVK